MRRKRLREGLANMTRTAGRSPTICSRLSARANAHGPMYRRTRQAHDVVKKIKYEDGAQIKFASFFLRRAVLGGRLGPFPGEPIVHLGCSFRRAVDSMSSQGGIFRADHIRSVLFSTCRRFAGAASARRAAGFRRFRFQESRRGRFARLEEERWVAVLGAAYFARSAEWRTNRLGAGRRARRRRSRTVRGIPRLKHS